MSQKESKKEFLAVGSMLLGKEKDAKNRDTYYVKLNDNVTITVNGVSYTGNVLSVRRPTDKYDKMLEKGKMDKNEYDTKVSQFEKGGKLSFVKFELVAVKDA